MRRQELSSGKLRRVGFLIGMAMLVIGSLSACSSGSSASGSAVTGAPSSSIGPVTVSSAPVPASSVPLPAGPESSAAVASSAAGLAESAAPGGGADCGGAVTRVKAATTAFAQITSITMVAACGEVSIRTNLAPGVLGAPSVATGIKICDAAAAVAYRGDVYSVTVVATNGSELSIGTKDADCIP